MGFDKFWTLSKATLSLGSPLRLDQGNSFKLLLNSKSKITFQIDGESFKHSEGNATITIEYDYQINMLRYE